LKATSSSHFLIDPLAYPGDNCRSDRAGHSRHMQCSRDGIVTSLPGIPFFIGEPLVGDRMFQHDLDEDSHSPSDGSMPGEGALSDEG
jgi:hypothetical protein